LVLILTIILLVCPQQAPMGYRHAVPAARDDGATEATWPDAAFVVTCWRVQDQKDAPNHSAGEASPGLFTPDILLASQQPVGGPPISPSRRLLGAVLERALLDATGRPARQSERDDALAWFSADDEAPFSFRWISFHLGIEPDWLRSRLDDLRRRSLDQPPAATPCAALAPDAKDQRAA
jgi:hypothetical protein